MDTRSVSWICPYLIKGSGGHRTILDHANYLQSLGYISRIYLPGYGPSSQYGRKMIQDMFGFNFDEVYYGWENVTKSDIVIATAWFTAEYVKNISFDCKKLYFVQDYEPGFMPYSYERIRARESYTYGLIPITIGRWLKVKLETEFGIKSYFYDFGASSGEFERHEREDSVCFVYQPEKPRRCAELGLKALSIVKCIRPKTKIYLYGSNHKVKGSKKFENLGLLSTDECLRLYKKCSVGLCLSASNPSRIPFEMMSQGLPTVELYGENTIYDFPDGATLLSEATPESIAHAIVSILESPTQKEKMSIAAQSYMKNRSLDSEKRKFAELLSQIMSIDDHLDVHSITAPQYSAPPHVCKELKYYNLNLDNDPVLTVSEKIKRKLPPSLFSLCKTIQNRIRRWG